MFNQQDYTEQEKIFNNYLSNKCNIRFVCAKNHYGLNQHYTSSLCVTIIANDDKKLQRKLSCTLLCGVIDFIYFCRRSAIYMCQSRDLLLLLLTLPCLKNRLDVILVTLNLACAVSGKVPIAQFFKDELIHLDQIF